ncbi:MAG: [FeFe] hydrogenase H-cluster radical SAM maturase HydG [Defluviitaleaceae bacterium]|nr:[FeFe] hydrogenase H-cluster radical SAM maturase HydG [Defluviitaleaceae bacterium]
MFELNQAKILDAVEWADKNSGDRAKISAILQKAADCNGLNHREASLLLAGARDDELFALAGEIKRRFYGSRIVLFAPLYLSNYCVNTCAYCPFHGGNRDIERKKLSQSEIEAQVRALLEMGHKRIVIESGDHPTQNSMDYITESIATIYGVRHKKARQARIGHRGYMSAATHSLEAGSNFLTYKNSAGRGQKTPASIQRINVNIGASSVEDYAKLATANIGTYTLFQETYDRARYEELHPGSAPKSNYDWQLGAMDRAMQAGLDDVGIGVLFGLSDYRFELAAMLSHAEYLEAEYGAGPHTISVPRGRSPVSRDAETHDEGNTLSQNRNPFSSQVSERDLLRIVATIRIAAPYTGIIASTRENADTRAKMLAAGVSQISGGSRTSVGGYAARQARNEHREPVLEAAHSLESGNSTGNATGSNKNSAQFETHDNRTLGEVVNWLMENGHIPSFCTACYREGRTGDRFMELCKSGKIQDFCHPNALLTLQEYLIDHADKRGKFLGEKLIARETAGTL